MKKQIPDFLIEMSKQLNEQDNRCTADPIFQVRCKEYLVTKSGYNENHFEIHLEELGGFPCYSSKKGFDNSEAHGEFYEFHRGWCNKWLEDDGLKTGLNSFTENFDFDEAYNAFSLPDGVRIIYLQEVEKVVKTCLTEADANAFIKRKQHDYPSLYIYVESMCFCPQMIELRRWIMELNNER